MAILHVKSPWDRRMHRQLLQPMASTPFEASMNPKSTWEGERSLHSQPIVSMMRNDSSLTLPWPFFMSKVREIGGCTVNCEHKCPSWISPYQSTFPCPKMARNSKIYSLISNFSKRNNLSPSWISSWSRLEVQAVDTPCWRLRSNLHSSR